MKVDLKKFRELKTEASLLRMCGDFTDGQHVDKMAFGTQGELYVKADSRAKNKVLRLVVYPDRREDLTFRMCKSGAEQMFNLPEFGAPKNCWIVAAVDDGTNDFLHGLFVGTFNECLNKLVDADLPSLQKSYNKHLLNQGSKLLVASRQKLLDDMATELTEAEREYEQTIAFIRNSYRARLSDLTALLDQAQADADKKDKATYLFELYGYPESKTYGSFKEVRRAHSRRNVPETPCVIYRIKGKKKTKFAKWSLADRIWTLI